VSSLLDAVQLLSRLSSVPNFVVWLVGGSEAETAFILDIIGAREHVAELHRNGRLLVWGRVAADGLAELYARASVVVMPSLREQFGIVAVEAMMCGTPVVASRVGGLPDIVLDGYAGTLVDPDAPDALANAVLGYLRNPDRVRREGLNAERWARTGFDAARTYPRIAEVYRTDVVQQSFINRAVLRKEELDELAALTSEVLHERCVATDVSSSDHTSAIVTTSSGRFFCKRYRPERADHISVLPVAASLRRERRLGDYAGRLEYHRDNPAVPRVLHVPTTAVPVAVFEYCDPVPGGTSDSLLQHVASAFRSHCRIPVEDIAMTRYMDALRAVGENTTLHTIETHDIAAAELNSRLNRGVPRFHQVHPQLEMRRIQLLLESRAWALSEAITSRILATIEFVTGGREIVLERPQMCHGSLKPEHLLTSNDGRIVACDTDSSRYVVGNFDEVHHVWNQVTLSPAYGAGRALTRLSRIVAPDAVATAIDWLVVYILFDALLAATTGRLDRLSNALRFCHDLPHALRRVIP